MWYPATIKTPAVEEPVSVEAARRQCGLSDSSQDDQLKLLIAASRAYIEKYCNIRLPVQVVTVPFDSFHDLARIPEAPVGDVVAIHFVDGDGAEQVVPATVYEKRLDGLSPTLALAFGQRWPAHRPGSRITIELLVGFEELPKDLEAALLLLVASQFTFARADLLLRREDVEGIGSFQWGGAIEVSQAVGRTMDALLENYRCWPLT